MSVTSCAWGGDFTTGKEGLEQLLTEKNVSFKLDDNSWTVDFSDQDKILTDCQKDQHSDFDLNKNSWNATCSPTESNKKSYDCAADDDKKPQINDLTQCMLQAFVKAEGLEIVLAGLRQNCTKRSENELWDCEPAGKALTILKDCKPDPPAGEQRVDITCGEDKSCKFAVTSEPPMSLKSTSMSAPTPSQSTSSQSTPSQSTVNPITTAPTSTSTESGAKDTSGLNAAIGVVAAFFAIALFVILFLLWRRRKDKCEPSTLLLLELHRIPQSHPVQTN